VNSKIGKKTFLKKSNFQQSEYITNKKIRGSGKNWSRTGSLKKDSSLYGAKVTKKSKKKLNDEYGHTMSSFGKKTNLEKFLEKNSKHSHLKKFKPGSMRTNSQLKKPGIKPKRKGDTHHAGFHKKSKNLVGKSKKSKLMGLQIQTSFDQDKEASLDESITQDNELIMNPVPYGQNISFANNRISNEMHAQEDYNIYHKAKP
jgi:hypothetical protein